MAAYKLELSCVQNIIPRSKSGASKSRPRWASHTRIGNVWEYPPPPAKCYNANNIFVLCYRKFVTTVVDKYFITNDITCGAL